MHKTERLIKEQALENTRSGSIKTSKRQTLFFCFEWGFRPAYAARLTNTPLTTAFRYYQQWKKLPLNFFVKYKVARVYYRELGGRDKRKIARVLAEELSTTEHEVLIHMQKPWALHQIVIGRWRQWPIRIIPEKAPTIIDTVIRALAPLTYSEEVSYILTIAFNQGVTDYDTEDEILEEEEEAD